MSYTTEKISGNKVRLTFTIPAEDFETAVQKAYLKNRGRISIPGFRKGKAPRFVVERMYGADIFYDDALNAILPDLYDNAVEAEKLEVVDRPETSADEIVKGQDVVVRCEVYVRPEVKLGDYKGLFVEIDHQVVTDADVDARIQQDRTKNSRTVEILDRPVETGDTVNLDYAGTVDGVAFDGGTAQGQTLEIGSHSFIPGFEEQMVGMCVAEERDLQVKFPEEYHAENLAGKDAVFHVKVNSISRSELPELDDDFAADVSDFTTFAEYRESIVEELNKQAEKNNQVAAENAVVEKAVANAEVDIPPAMVMTQTQYMLRDMENRMRYQGIRMEDFLKYTGQTMEQLVSTYRPEAERRVKVELVLDAIRKAENIEADDEAYENQLAEQAERLGRDLEDFRASLTDDQKQALRDAAAVQRTVDLMMKDATVTDKPAETGKDADKEEAAAE